jgi:hypothetical protein
MDIVSHGLWGGLAFGRKNKKSFWMSFLFGISPDLLSFGIFSAANIFGLASGPDWSGGPPDASSIPEYVHMLYNITHSFVIFALIFLFVWWLRKKPLYEMLAWPLHILLDIPTHTTAFFPTPFLWPFVEYRVDGVPWSHLWIFFPNWVFLIVLYLYFFVYKKRKKT